jgi:hypothetical protein
MQFDYLFKPIESCSRLNITQGDKNLILGGNAVLSYYLQMPFSRLFKDYPKHH